MDFTAGGGAVGADGAGPAAVAEEVKVKDIFDLKLTEVDAKAKIKVIKEVRAITGLGLKEVRFPSLSLSSANWVSMLFVCVLLCENSGLFALFSSFSCIK
jgi:hypothetical protein